MKLLSCRRLIAPVSSIQFRFLLPELQRLALRPAEAARVMDTADPTPATAHSMIEDTVSRSIVQWYAYGLLEAA